MDLKRCKRLKVDTTTKKKSQKSCCVRTYQYSVAETKRVTVGWILELPIPILYDILSRLPMETIFSCRCVCKTFLKIVTDPYFGKLHHTKAPKVDHSLIIKHETCPRISLTYISDLIKPSGFFSGDFDYESSSSLWRHLNILPTELQSKRDYNIFFAGSCNGLLCLLYSQERRDIFYVCNPILGEFMFLPHHRDDVYHYGAIGFCPKTGLYKVIGFYSFTKGCKIHTLGTSDWRNIENAPSPNNRKFDSSLNGNLHWIASSTSNLSTLICSLNLETEKIHYIPPPSCINHENTKRISHISVATLDGLFCIYYLYDQAQLEVCVMKEYGVESSWTKELTMNLNFDNLLQPLTICPRELLNNGDLLVYYTHDKLVYYSLRKGIFIKLSSYPGRCILHASSFISLKDIAGDKDVEVIRKIPLVRIGWINGDVKRLKKAVSSNMYNIPGSTYPRIAWGSVAAEVATHSVTECKSKWYEDTR